MVDHGDIGMSQNPREDANYHMAAPPDAKDEEIARLRAQLAAWRAGGCS